MLFRFIRFCFDCTLINPSCLQTAPTLTISGMTNPVLPATEMDYTAQVKIPTRMIFGSWTRYLWSVSLKQVPPLTIGQPTFITAQIAQSNSFPSQSDMVFYFAAFKVSVWIYLHIDAGWRCKCDYSNADRKCGSYRFFRCRVFALTEWIYFELV